MKKLAVLALLAASALPVSAMSQPAPGDWPSYGYDMAATRYSPLTQITPANVGKMALAWRKPIHFVWGGRDDVFTEAWGRAWAGRYPQATFDLLPEAGHFLQDTHGSAIAELMLRRMAT